MTMWEILLILWKVNAAMSLDVSTIDLLTPLAELGEACGYESCPHVEEDAINVHIVPHTHGELGYTNSFYEHYSGLDGVLTPRIYSYKNILDSVLTELWSNERRKFTVSDLPYFYHWWQDRDATVRRMVYELVRQGRLHFAGGSWGMPDEATTSYHAIIDLFTYALRKQNATFLSCGRPLVSWQADAFGHSREFASLVAQMGFHGHFINPISYDDELTRMTTRSLEFVWRGSDDLGAASDIYTHKLFDGYWAPPGFCFGGSCVDPLIIVPDTGPEYARKRVEAFLKAVLSRQAPYYISKHVLVIMGQRQGYYDAKRWFDNIDALIALVNQRGLQKKNKVYMFYSTPACYLKAVHEARPKLTNKQDDFLPLTYDRQTHATGLYTSRPVIKFLAREIHRFAQMTKQIQVLAKLGNNDKKFEEIMWIAGVIQDHNVITGSMRPHVTTYYYRKIDLGVQKAVQIMRDGFNTLRKAPQAHSWVYTCHFNVSACHNVEGGWSYIIVYNPLAWPVTVPIRLPVRRTIRVVYDPEGNHVDAVMIKIPDLVTKMPKRNSTATDELVFMAHNLPPMGYRSYYTEEVTRKKRSIIKKLNKTKKKKYLTRQTNNMKIDDKSLLDDDTEYEYFDEGDSSTARTKILFGNVSRVDFSDRLDGYIMTPPSRVETTSTATDVDDKIDGLYMNSAVDIDTTASALPNSTAAPESTSTVSTPEYYDDEETTVPPTTTPPQKTTIGRSRKMLSSNYYSEESTDLFIRNEYIRVNMHSNRRVTSMELCNGVKINLNIEFYYYVSDDPEKFDQPERKAPGAYIFRPMDPKPVAIADYITTEVHKTVLVEELHIKYSEYAMAVLRIYRDVPTVEVDWVVGPVPMGDDLGKDVFIRYTTDLDNKGVFFTDSNGRQMVKRIRDARATYEPDNDDRIPSNIYPVTSKIYIEDLTRNLRLSIFNDRSQGGTSLNDGQIDLMVHRRIFTDDDGIMTYLNETIEGKGLMVRGKHYIYLTKADYKPNRIFEKRFAKEIELAPYVFTSPHSSYLEQNKKKWLSSNNKFAGVRKKLPIGVHVLTLEKWRDDLLLRLENFLEKSDAIKDGVKTVFVRDLFNGFNITGARETALGTNVWVENSRPLRWNTDRFVKSFNEVYGNVSNLVFAEDGEELPGQVVVDEGITLAPQQIRTFVVSYVNY